MKKHYKYLWYIIRHKYYVFIECWKIGLYWRGIVHDLSKLLPSEWFAYAEYFYGKKLRGNFTPNYQIGPFNIAWLKHIHRNPHHWQYWILREDGGDVIPLSMPIVYMKEMLADWRGAGRAITGKDNTPEWYQSNKGKMQLHPDTQTWIQGKLEGGLDEIQDNRKS